MPNRGNRRKEGGADDDKEPGNLDEDGEGDQGDDPFTEAVFADY